MSVRASWFVVGLAIAAGFFGGSVTQLVTATSNFWAIFFLFFLPSAIWTPYFAWLLIKDSQNRKKKLLGDK